MQVDSSDTDRIAPDKFNNDPFLVIHPELNASL